MTTDPKIFLPAGFFMIRSPLLPVDFFLETCSKNTHNQVLCDYFSNPLIREAILLASPSLYFSLQEDMQNKKTISDKKFFSLLRYLIRMSTRSTPFGLFSAVGFGTIGKKTQIFFNPKQKIARPNMQWLYEMINCLEKDMKILENCKIKANSPILSYAGRLFLLCDLDLEKMRHNERSIKKSILTDFIMENSSQWILYKELQGKLVKEFPSLSSDKLKAFLLEMFNNQFIISELIPNLLNDNPFDHFFSRLKAINPELENSFRLLNKILKQYNETIPGCGLPLLEKINELLYEFYPKKSSSNQNNGFVQVDAAFSSKNTLSHKIAEEAANVAALIWKITTSNSRKKYLNNYHLQFLEKYGTEQLVPFFDLINENTGLGIPSHYLSTEETGFHIEKNIPFEQFLLKKYQEAIYHGEKEVVLLDSEIKDYLTKHPYSDAPTSLELFCEILATDENAIDKGDFHLTLGLSQASQQIGNTFGRFLHILPEEAKTALLKAYADEQQLEPEKIFVTFSWLPASSSLGNVMVGKNLRNFALVFPSSGPDEGNTIAYNDIHVGASHNGLYLFSKQLNRELILTIGNAVNQDFAPPPFRLLLDIAKENAKPIQGIYWDQFDYFSHLPRLRYNKTYLSLARWHLHIEDISLKKKDASKKDLITWLRRWNVCRFVKMVYYDQYLLLDLEQENHLAQILSNLIKNDKVCLIENKSIKTSAWAQSNKKAHFTEIIIPLLKNQSLTAKTFMHPQIEKQEDQSIEKRVHRLGSDWVYLKLFCCKSIQEEFLKKAIPRLIQEIVEKKACEKWFYIRYQENTIDSHIRLRIKAPHDQILQTVLPIIHNWSEELIEERFLKDISFHSYERELERYGGVGLMEFAETLFHVDSITCISLLQNYPKITTLPIYGIAALSIVDFLTSLNLSSEDQITILEEIVSSKKALEGYRVYRKQLLELASIKAINGEFSLLKQIFSLRHPYCNNYIKKIKVKHINFLSSKGKKILCSFIHMHCNRLLGIDLYLEEKAILFAAETIKGVYVSEKKKDLCSC